MFEEYGHAQTMLKLQHLSAVRDTTQMPLVFIMFMVHTNRWDPILNYPGSMGVVLRLRLYLNEYLSDLHVFSIRF